MIAFSGRHHVNLVTGIGHLLKYMSNNMAEGLEGFHVLHICPAFASFSALLIKMLSFHTREKCMVYIVKHGDQNVDVPRTCTQIEISLGKIYNLYSFQAN